MPNTFSASALISFRRSDLGLIDHIEHSRHVYTDGRDSPFPAAEASQINMRKVDGWKTLTSISNWISPHNMIELVSRRLRRF
jgi:hypothetical protein